MENPIASYSSSSIDDVELLEQHPELSNFGPIYPNTINLQKKMDKYFQSQPSAHVAEYPRSCGQCADDRYTSDFNLLDRQREIIECQQTTMKAFASNLELPKREFLYFDGNPVDYPRFIKNFETNIERKIIDNSTRLSYLIQYTLGIAKEAIQNCVILPEEEGYFKDKEILKKNFGQKHNIVRTFIEKVITGTQIKSGETERLMQLARDMRNCLLNSIQMNYKEI